MRDRTIQNLRYGATEIPLKLRYFQACENPRAEAGRRQESRNTPMVVDDGPDQIKQDHTRSFQFAGGRKAERPARAVDRRPPSTLRRESTGRLGIHSDNSNGSLCHRDGTQVTIGKMRTIRGQGIVMLSHCTLLFPDPFPDPFPGAYAMDVVEVFIHCHLKATPP